MTDQILIMNKLNKWFWYFGVLPLVISYLMCLNFTAEYLSIAMIERPSITLRYMGELLGFTTLGLAIIMIIWCATEGSKKKNKYGAPIKLKR